MPTKNAAARKVPESRRETTGSSVGVRISSGYRRSARPPADGQEALSAIVSQRRQPTELAYTVQPLEPTL